MQEKSNWKAFRSWVISCSLSLFPFDGNWYFIFFPEHIHLLHVLHLFSMSLLIRNLQSMLLLASIFSSPYDRIVVLPLLVSLIPGNDNFVAGKQFSGTFSSFHWKEVKYLLDLVFFGCFVGTFSTVIVSDEPEICEWKSFKKPKMNSVFLRFSSASAFYIFGFPIMWFGWN